MPARHMALETVASVVGLPLQEDSQKPESSYWGWDSPEVERHHHMLQEPLIGQLMHSLDPCSGRSITRDNVIVRGAVLVHVEASTGNEQVSLVRYRRRYCRLSQCSDGCYRKIVLQDASTNDK